jgi:hypothetical protein
VRVVHRLPFGQQLPAHGLAVEPITLLPIGRVGFERLLHEEGFRRYAFGIFADRLADLMALAKAVAFHKPDHSLACAAGDRSHRRRPPRTQGASGEVKVNGMAMKTNVGPVDRALRVLPGLVLPALTISGVIGAWGWIGVGPLATPAMGYCPLYQGLGFSTCPLKKA